MREKILLLNPPMLDSKGAFNRPIRFPTFTYATFTIHPPLFLAYVASCLRSQGFSVDLIDAVAGGYDLKEVLKIIDKTEPDYLIVETSTPSFYNDIEVARKVREMKRLKIILVGTHVSVLPDEALRYDWIDAVVMGEYEFSLAEYLKSRNPNTKGIGVRNSDGKIRINPRREFIEDLDVLPYPARDLLEKYRYYDPILKNPFTFILAGRGCPYQCIFCNWPQVLTGRRYRKRNPRKVVDELLFIKKNFNFRSVLFNDDTFNVDKNYVQEICREIIGCNLKLNWAAYSRADFDDYNILELMRRAGCFLLKVGVESGDEEILEKAKKQYSLKKVKRAVAMMRELGFHVHATFVLGLPGENKDTIRKTIQLAKELKSTTVQFSMAIPYPGTKFYEFLKENSLLCTENWQDYMPFNRIFDYPDLTAEEMRTGIKRAYRQYYLRPQMFGFALRRFLHQPHEFMHNLKQFILLLIKKY